MALGRKNLNFAFFLVFLLVSSTSAQWNRDNLVKSAEESSYKARENWYRKAVFWPSVVIKVPVQCQKSEKKWKFGLKGTQNTDVHTCRDVKKQCTVLLQAQLTHRTLTATFVADSG